MPLRLTDRRLTDTVIGTTLSHFRVTAKLGEGGMGEVYQATDTRLDREVALKFIREDFAEDAAHLDRFEREAKVLASLNHPHVAAIHGLEEADGCRFLVLELVEGNTLTEFLHRGPPPVGQSLEFACQITEALAAAHSLGIVHRDLKPGNIKITEDGSIKVLDFGLAQVVTRIDAASPGFTESPTMTDDGTRTGGRVGTAAYMSPEQVRGQAVDEQTDIWAFGCVLFELLTNQKAFQGRTDSDTAAAILEHPPNWSLLPAATPDRIRIMLERCLRKDRSRRLHSISDARIEIEDGGRDEIGIARRSSRKLPRHRWLWIAAVVLLLALVTLGIRDRLRGNQPSSSPARITRLSINLPQDQHLVGGFSSSLSLSPDGSRLAYIGQSTDLNQRPQLFVRDLGEFAPRPIPGTDDARGPFFSPDGRWLAFFANGTLWKAPIAGGAPEPLCDTSNVPTGATWATDDRILFTTFALGVMEVSPAGGEPRSLTAPDYDDGELGHQMPQALPDNSGILFGIVTGKVGRIAVLNEDTGETKNILEGSNIARYLPTGHIVYIHEGGLWAVPFDLDHLEVRGSPTRVLEDVVRHFAISDSGTLLYIAAPAIEVRLAWIDRDGQETPIDESAGTYGTVRLAPDGSRIAFGLGHEGARDIWIYDLERGTRSRLTTGGLNGFPLWSPNGESIAFSSTRAGDYDLYWKPTHGTDEAESLLAREHPQFPESWSSDGKLLLFTEFHPDSTSDIWALPFSGDREPFPVVVTPFADWDPRLSPDGNWLVYASNESGRAELYVQPFPEGGQRLQISTDGGALPLWSTDGTEILYRHSEGRIMAVTVSTKPSFSVGIPRMVVQAQITGDFEAEPNGQRFLVKRPEHEDRTFPSALRVVLHWFEELQRTSLP